MDQMQITDDELGQTWGAIYPGLTIGDQLRIADQLPQGGCERPAVNGDLMEYGLGDGHINRTCTPA
jgi:hypothetical protein